LALNGLAGVFAQPASNQDLPHWFGGPLWVPGDTLQFWVFLHITLLLLAAVGVCVGFVASLMYLVQARRLKAKLLPGQRIRLLSLERLEAMNRHAINLALPLMTIGMLIGGVLLVQAGPSQPDSREASGSLIGTSLRLGRMDPRMLSTLGLWLVFAILVYLRYGYHLRGRHIAWLTVVAFPLLLVSLATAHRMGGGGSP
jgi:ABC-type transport system involved in cytochrome c biogenesis permease subunit